MYLSSPKTQTYDTQFFLSASHALTTGVVSVLKTTLILKVQSLKGLSREMDLAFDDMHG
jgi:hypothetical protein